MKSLLEIYNQLCKDGYCSDKGTIHSYVKIYEKVLKPYRDKKINVLEIGLFNGHSLRLWEKYFTNATVYGIDCSETPHDGMADLRPMIAEGTHNIHIFDATNEEEVGNRFDGIKFDVIIIDASHDLQQEIGLYNIWKNYLFQNHVYIIEDAQNIDTDKKIFLELDRSKNIEVVDLRHIKNRYDDVLIVIKNK